MPEAIEDLIKRKKPRRKVQGIAAALLPYKEDGTIAVEAYQEHLITTHRAGLMNAVNMDTGYVNFLSATERREVLGWTRDALGGNVPFVAGAFIENDSGDAVALYREQMDAIAKIGGIPIMFQSARLHGKPAAEMAAIYQAASHGYPQVLAFELSPSFAPNGSMFDDETFQRLLDIPEIMGMKHSSLDRTLELRRLCVRDQRRPEFRIYTGNDLGIDMIEYGSDYLLGLATFAPEKFAERDRLWEAGHAVYYELSDALQYLGNIAFRDPIPAYKHSAAVFLHLTGRIPSATTHPKNLQRPSWEEEILEDCALRLKLERRPHRSVSGIWSLKHEAIGASISNAQPSWESSIKPEASVAARELIFRKTNAHIGRHVAVRPENSTMRHLAYGRILLGDSKRSEVFNTGDRETGLIVLSGEVTVAVGKEALKLGRFDSMYVPRDSEVTLQTESTTDLAEFSSDVSNKYPLQVVRYADVEKDKELNFNTGGPGSRRHLNMLLAKNIQAGRLVAGFTDSEPGNWTSWPPHEHAKMLEEIYVFFNMPEPAFGIQLVYNDTEYPELVTVVRDGDAVLMPRGFHPNVSVPGHRISFLWAMAAHGEVVDRQFGVVNVQSQFDNGSSGLEAGREK